MNNILGNLEQSHWTASCRIRAFKIERQSHTNG